jgi:hypothetical protein
VVIIIIRKLPTGAGPGARSVEVETELIERAEKQSIGNRGTALSWKVKTRSSFKIDNLSRILFRIFR